MRYIRIFPLFLAVITSSLFHPKAWSYDIIFVPNSFVQLGPIILPGAANPNAASAATIVNQSLVKVKSKARLNAHSRRGASTSIFGFGYEIDFVIQPGPGEPNQAIPIQLTVAATGTLDTNADASAPRRGTSYAKADAAFEADGELPGLLLELQSDQRASARAPATDDPPESVVTLSKTGFVNLMADGNTRHTLGCGAVTEAWSRLKDWQGILQLPAATAVSDFYSGSFGFSCTLGIEAATPQQEQYPQIQP